MTRFARHGNRRDDEKCAVEKSASAFPYVVAFYFARRLFYAMRIPDKGLIGEEPDNEGFSSGEVKTMEIAQLRQTQTVGHMNYSARHEDRPLR